MPSPAHRALLASWQETLFGALALGILIVCVTVVIVHLFKRWRRTHNR